MGCEYILFSSSTLAKLVENNDTTHLGLVGWMAAQQEGAGLASSREAQRRSRIRHVTALQQLLNLA